MTAVVVEESEDVRSIITPDLRLQFRRAGDRWTHSIDLRPGPWQTVASAVEWPDDDPDHPPSPTYQELHFQEDGDEVVALAVGQAGAHHFSASFRVSYESWRVVHYSMSHILQDRSESTVDIDVADRCRAEEPCSEARYLVHEPPIHTFLGGPDDSEQPGHFSRDWRSCLVWEAGIDGNYDVHLIALRDPSASRVSVLEHKQDRSWLVRIAPNPPSFTATNRFSYRWGHRRVNAFERPEDRNIQPPWSLAGAIPPSTLEPT